MAPYLMHFRKYLINIWWVLFYWRHYTFDVKTCFPQNRYVFDVIVTSWASFIYYISLNFVNISTLFEEIKHLRSRAPNKILLHIIRINKTQILLKYLFGARLLGVKFLKKRREDVQILQVLLWRFNVWEARYFLSLPLKTMVCRHVTN
jgi:hypothetical protein